MVNGEYKQILFKIFELLNFSEGERAAALESFKKKLAAEVLQAIEKELPQDQQEWLKENMAKGDPHDPKVAEVRSYIHGKYSKEELQEKARPLFKKILRDYVAFMSQGLEAEKAEKLKLLAENL